MLKSYGDEDLLIIISKQDGGGGGARIELWGIHKKKQPIGQTFLCSKEICVYMVSDSRHVWLVMA